MLMRYRRHSKCETKRSEVSDLESRFGAKSGIPNRLFLFASRAFGMTVDAARITMQ